MRIILHVDMDYFFAQVEERKNSALKGKPVVVGADPKQGKGRGVVSTCNYEARKFGIHSGQPISVAYRKCPEAVFLPVNFKLYEEASRAVMSIFRRHAEKFEQMSVDEAYLDISKRAKNYEEAEQIGKKIKKEVLEKEKLTCSIGIGPNKLISKIAANKQKPDGLTVVKPEEVRKFLNPKKVNVLYGVGPKTAAHLNSLGIETVGELAKQKKDFLIAEFGTFGEELYEMARGIDEREVSEEWVTKSIGRQHTFEKDTRDKKLIMSELDDMIREIYRDLRAEDFLFKNITLKVRYEDFETHTKGRTLKDYTDSVKIMRQVAEESLEPFLADPRKIRLVGISVHSLINRKELKKGKLA